MAKVTDAHGETLSSSEGQTGEYGLKIIPVESLFDSLRLISILKHSSNTATHCTLQTEAGVDIVEVAFSGDIASFPGSTELSTGVSYRIIADGQGSSITGRFLDGSVTYPINKTNINYTGGINNGNDDTNGAFNIVSVTTSILKRRGRGQAEIRTSSPVDREDGKVLSLEPEEVNIIKKDRVDLDA